MAPRGLFVDEEFPAKWYSLFNPNDAVTWKRPHELREKPMLFVDGSSRFDINQGRLGDCWFLAACAAVAERPKLMNKIIPEGQVLYGPGYDGSLKFRFWNLGSWEEVRIDDKLPVNAKGKPVYAHCKEDDEFWMPLLEKAFAKYNGDKYSYINGGWVCEGLIRLTGFSSQRLTMRNWSYEDDFQKMKDGLENGGVIVVGVMAPGPGIPGGHAYTITNAVRVPKEENKGTELQLIRVRNPWGKVEWSGAWRDGDKRWDELSEKLRDLLQYQPGEDGEYWMDIRDFSKYFQMGIVLQDHPKNIKNMKIVHSLKGCWKGETAGGPPTDVASFVQNPQFLLMAIGEENAIIGSGLSDEIETYVEVVYDAVRTEAFYGEVGIFIFEVPEAERKLSAEELLKACPTAGVNNRSSVGVRCRALLEPGHRYIVIPAVDQAEVEKNFIVRVYSQHPRILFTELAALGTKK